MQLFAGRQLRLTRRLPKGDVWLAGAMIAPAAFVIFFVAAVPLVGVLWMSLFHHVLTNPNNQPFVGLGNYTNQLGNPDFWAAVQRSVIFTVASTPPLDSGS